MNRVPWVALTCGALVLAGWGLSQALTAGWLRLPECPFKAFTGLPCLTCGLTRWGLAMGAGDLQGAWRWHPGATLALGALPVLAAADGVRAWRGQAYPALPQGAWARWAVVGLLAFFWGLQVARGV